MAAGGNDLAVYVGVGDVVRLGMRWKAGNKKFVKLVEMRTMNTSKSRNQSVDKLPHTVAMTFR